MGILLSFCSISRESCHFRSVLCRVIPKSCFRRYLFAWRPDIVDSGCCLVESNPPKIRETKEVKTTEPNYALEPTIIAVTPRAYMKRLILAVAPLFYLVGFCHAQGDTLFFS